MKKLVMFLAVFSLLLIASCVGPGWATGPQTSKVQVAVKPAVAGVLIDMCDATYQPPACQGKTNSAGTAVFTSVPVGTRGVTATSERGSVTKHPLIKDVQAPRAFVLTMDVSSILPDSDGDDVADVLDNCPSTFNADQADKDRDKIGDVCDNCVLVSNKNQADSDKNGIGNVCQVCVTEKLESGQVLGTAWSKKFSARIVDKLMIVNPNIHHSISRHICRNSISATISLSGVAVGSDSTSGCPAALKSVLDFNDAMADSLSASWFIGSRSWGIGNLIIVTRPCFAIGIVKPEVVCQDLVGISTASTSSDLMQVPQGALVTLQDNQACYCLDASNDGACDG